MSSETSRLGKNPLLAETSEWDLVRHGLLIFAWFGAAVAAGIVVGHWIGEYLLKNPDTRLGILNVKVSLGTGALAISALLVTIKDTLLILCGLPAHLQSVNSKPALLDMVKLFFTVLSFIVATKVVQIEQDAALFDIRSEPLEVIAAAPVTNPEPIIVFPLLFERNGKKVDGVWTEGVQPDEARILGILAAIDSCVDRASKAPIAPSVTLEVVAYASSQEYGDEKALQTSDGIRRSNDFNVELANERIATSYQAVSGKVRDLGLSDSVRVDRVPDWRSFEEMVAARSLLDRVQNADRKELENWTRRADVKLLRAGNCTRLSILKNVGVIRVPSATAASKPQHRNDATAPT